ncbi:hypothetical protein LCM08_00565 [Salipiger pacificus]|nr:hypothetical protein [Alloyangia pacifica]
MRPHDKMMTAIGILQSHILAQDSNLVSEVLFPNRRFDICALEHVEKMLFELLPVLDEIDDDTESRLRVP